MAVMMLDCHTWIFHVQNIFAFKVLFRKYSPKMMIPDNTKKKKEKKKKHNKRRRRSVSNNPTMSTSIAQTSL